MSTLRSRDWRFLLDRADDRFDDVAAIGFPTRRRLARLSTRGEVGTVICRWGVPRLLGVQRARRNLRAAGFSRTVAYWTGPKPGPEPEFWLPLDIPAAVELLLASRPPGSRADSVVRRLWRFALRAGALAPVHMLAIAAGPSGKEAEDQLPRPDAWMLLTPGSLDASKAIGIPFYRSGGAPDTIVKFARVEEAEYGINGEARNLQALARDLPQLRCVPKPRAVGRRAGRLALAQSYLRGEPLSDSLARGEFPLRAPEVTATLVELAGVSNGSDAGDRTEQLVREPLREFCRALGPALPAAAVDELRRRLEPMQAPPPAFEHRDLKPWNVIVTTEGPALIDWEDAEQRGLPGLDLAFFLTSAAMLVDNAISSLGAPLEKMVASHLRLLDPGSETGSVAGRCIAAYCAGSGLERSEFERLRLLGWTQRALYAISGEHTHHDGANPFRVELYLSLIESELEHLPAPI